MGNLNFSNFNGQRTNDLEFMVKSSRICFIFVKFLIVPLDGSDEFSFSQERSRMKTTSIPTTTSVTIPHIDHFGLVRWETAFLSDLSSGCSY